MLVEKVIEFLSLPPQRPPGIRAHCRGGDGGIK